LIFSIPGSKDTLEHFLNRLSADLGCKKFSYNQKTIIGDIGNISNYLKKEFPENNSFDFNSFMVGVKCVIGSLKTTYDKMTGANLTSSDNILSKMAGFLVNGFSQLGMSLMNINEKAKPIVEKISSEINSLYYNYLLI